MWLELSPLATESTSIATLAARKLAQLAAGRLPALPPTLVAESRKAPGPCPAATSIGSKSLSGALVPCPGAMPDGWTPVAAVPIPHPVAMPANSKHAAALDVSPQVTHASSTSKAAVPGFAATPAGSIFAAVALGLNLGAPARDLQPAAAIPGPHIWAALRGSLPVAQGATPAMSWRFEAAAPGSPPAGWRASPAQGTPSRNAEVARPFAAESQ